MIKLTAPNGEAVSVNPAAITSMHANDGTYHKDAKTVLHIGGGVQAVKETVAEVQSMIRRAPRPDFRPHPSRLRLMERLKGWKTVIVGVLVGLPLVLLEIVEQFHLIDPASILPEPWGQRVALAVSVAMILLRLITTGPVGAKPDPDVKAGD
jgi:uncharacterized protein YlzI (FlbEa/FlbD family)